MKDVVISLCDKTGNMVKPWAEAGYECICVMHGYFHVRRSGLSEKVWMGIG